jgi:Protein kinase domain
MRRTGRHQVRGASPVEVGRSIDGYRVERIVCARPGMNVLAEAAKLRGERVTLDVMSTPLRDDRKLRRRAPRLASTRGSLKHPNVLRMLRVVDGGQRLHLAPLPPGTTTLGERLADSPLTPHSALTLLGQVAGALETARAKGLLHRGLSPRAILVTGEDPPKAVLTDFGIGTPDAAACERVGAVEEAGYRSPEEIRGEPVRPESNVYSLACILVEALTGEPPYAYDRALLTVHAHLSEPPPRVSERRAELPAALDAVVAKAMAKDPRERHSSPEALITAAQESLGVRVPIPVVRATRQRVERRPAAPEPAHAAKPAPRPAAAPRRRAGSPKPASQPAAAPSRRAGSQKPASEPAAAPRTRARPRRGHSARQRRRLVPRAAPAWAGLLLVASAVAGFAAGSPGEPERAASILGTPVAGAEIDHGATAERVDRVFARLDARRAAARRQLTTASEPARQATTATALAGAHRRARIALVRAPGRQRMESQLVERLQSVEQAYLRLAAAARRRDEAAWRDSRDETRAREVDLELLMRTA